MFSNFLKYRLVKAINYFLIIGIIFQIVRYDNFNVLAQEKKIKGKIAGIGRDRAWINIGSNDGVKEGMLFQIKRKGEIIGTAKIVKISEASCEIKIISVVENIEVDLGDIVENIVEEVVEIPIKDEEEEKPEVELKEEKPIEQKVEEKIVEKVEEVKIEEVKEEIQVEKEGEILPQREMSGSGTSPTTGEGLLIVEKERVEKLEEEKKPETELKVEKPIEQKTEEKKITEKIDEKEKQEIITKKKKPKKKFTTYIIAGVVAVVALAALGGKGKEDKTTTGAIDVSSFPSGADVYLGTTFKGKTNPNLLIENVPAGIHKIKLTKTGCLDSPPTDVVVNPKQTTPLYIWLEPSDTGDDSPPPEPTLKGN